VATFMSHHGTFQTSHDVRLVSAIRNTRTLSILLTSLTDLRLQKIQKAQQTASRMNALGRSAHGRWFAHKGIPEDVRKEFARLYGVSREADLKSAGRHSPP
jgi:hypothetical protein